MGQDYSNSSSLCRHCPGEGTGNTYGQASRRQLASTSLQTNNRFQYDIELKRWMCAHGFFNPYLYHELKSHNIRCDESLQNLSQKQFDEIITVVKCHVLKDSETLYKQVGESEITPINQILRDFESSWKIALSTKPHVATNKIDRYITNGFIRPYGAMLYRNIPCSINEICFSYYHIGYELNEECIEWEKKLNDIVIEIEKIQNTNGLLLNNLWDKFDTKKKEKMDSNKSLSKLIYFLIAVYASLKDKNDQLPKFKKLEPLLLSVCDDIKDITEKYDFIEKKDFVENICEYLLQIAKQRNA